MKIIFLDFDGVMIPSRAYYMESQTKPVVTQFDPCAVGMLNSICEDYGAKIVLVTSWRRTDMWKEGIEFEDANSVEKHTLKDHCISQGLYPKHLHDDFECPFNFSSSKYHDVNSWLEDHPEVEGFAIIDDHLEDAYAPENQVGHIITPEFHDGLLASHINKLVDILHTPIKKKEENSNVE